MYALKCRKITNYKNELTAIKKLCVPEKPTEPTSQAERLTAKQLKIYRYSQLIEIPATSWKREKQREGTVRQRKLTSNPAIAKRRWGVGEAFNPRVDQLDRLDHLLKGRENISHLYIHIVLPSVRFAVNHTERLLSNWFLLFVFALFCFALFWLRWDMNGWTEKAVKCVLFLSCPCTHARKCYEVCWLNFVILTRVSIDRFSWDVKLFSDD